MIPTVVPNVMFGLLGALSGASLTTNTQPNKLQVLVRMNLVLLFVWSNVLIFSIWNQCSTESVVEDKANKPWRPVPAGLITARSGRRLLLALCPLALALSWVMGVQWETGLTLAFTWMYNDGNGGNNHPLVRNSLVAALFSMGHRGALKIGCGPKHELSSSADAWIAIIAMSVLTTMHVSDFHDKEGDLRRQRKTLPLLIGESLARRSVAVGVLFWSLVSAMYWRLWPLLWPVPLLSASIVAARELALEGPQEDRMTWVYWAFWLVCIYTSPLAATIADGR